MKTNQLLVATLVLGLGAAIYGLRRADATGRALVAQPALRPAAKGPGDLVRPESQPSPQPRPAPAPVAMSAEARADSIRPLTRDAAKNLARRTEKHRRYDSLFKRLGLTPAEADQFAELLIEQDDARADLQAAVKDQNLPGDGPEVTTLRNSLYAPIVRRLQDLLGNDGYEAYGAYEKTSYYREAFVSPMLNDFTSAAAPLSDAQFTQLTEVIAANDHPHQRTSTDVGNESSIDWQNVLSQAAGFLTPGQLAVIRARAGHRLGG
jgi:hypothetical protein